jgi:molybdopterin-guanine dinucleotide biosynthesis protein MobB
LIPYVHLVGYSDAGKTTLTADLIRLLKKRGYRVAAVKHAAHGYTADPPGTDSWCYAQAGADRVAIIGPDSYTIHYFNSPNHPLESILASFADMDLILVEGFKNAAGPKIEVFRQGMSAGRIPGMDSRLAVVSDVKLAEENCFLFSELDQLADFLVHAIIRIDK